MSKYFILWGPIKKDSDTDVKRLYPVLDDDEENPNLMIFNSLSEAQKFADEIIDDRYFGMLELGGIGQQYIFPIADEFKHRAKDITKKLDI